jgi:hypothetical protein
MKSHGIFGNARTRYKTAQKPMQNGQNLCFRPFHHRTKMGETCAISAQARETKPRRNFFRNERTRSTPLDPKLMFWSVSDCFVTAQKSMQNGPNWCN